MTPKEALNILDETVIRNLELKVVLSNALEKQIPKKPRVNDDSWFCCRSCGETFSLANTVHRKNKYCGNCGQALDWGDCE